MLQRFRTRGLETLHGLIVLVWLPLLFVLLIGLNKLYRPEMLFRDVNFPLYIYTLVITGLVFLGFRKQSDFEIRDFKWVESIRRTNFDVAVIALSMFLVVFATKDQAVSRLFLGTYLAASWASLLIINRFVPGILSRLVFSRKETIRVLLVGSPRLAGMLQGWGQWQSAIGIEVVGLVTFSEEESGPEGLPKLGIVEDLEAVIEKEKINQLIVLESKDSLGWVTFITRIGELYGCRILIYNQWEEYFNQPLIPVMEGSHTFFTFMEEPLEDPINRLLKRIMDLVIAIPVLVLVMPPLLLLAVVFQSLQSPGPLLYKQMRGGRRGEPFQIYKIRTMHHHNPDEDVQATKGDSRVFPFGDFMRRTSLDEIPQFLNVLRGQMSVVGPRPHMLEHDNRFSRLVDVYRNRHFIKPGITGLAQVRGFRGEIAEPRLIRERVRYDLEYIHNWSIWLEIAIVIKTFSQIIFPPKSAY